ncbi:MAG: type II pantothenate kinase [Clostridia bacterium]|nr:type II pantothenate kinase [Clostridia bacterium]
MITLGIDVGGSNTKIIGLRDGIPMEPIHVRATDPITSVFGALGKYISANNLTLKDVSKIMITGVGSSYLNEDIYGIPTQKVEELVSVGKGGLYLSNLEKAVVVSLGTGTAFVNASKDCVSHMGGTGVGGGTVLGLSSKLLNVRSFDSIIDLADQGDLSQVDLTIGDISKSDVSNMSAATTASNFGKISDSTSTADIAAGILNMVFQTVGLMAVFNARIANTNDVVVCGRLAQAPHCRETLEGIRALHGVNFIIPKNAEFATALGAALAASDNI